MVTEKTVSGVSAWSRLYEEQLGALRVPLDGDEVSLETAMARLYDTDRGVRRDPSLRDLPYKIELNSRGKIEMSPASNRRRR